LRKKHPAHVHLEIDPRGDSAFGSLFRCFLGGLHLLGGVVAAGLTVLLVGLVLVIRVGFLGITRLLGGAFRAKMGEGVTTLAFPRNGTLEIGALATDAHACVGFVRDGLAARRALLADDLQRFEIELLAGMLTSPW